MSAQITNLSSGSIGRMYARQNASAVYGVQKSAEKLEKTAPAQQVDHVTLSPLAPKPLTASFLQEAMAAGKNLGNQRALSDEQDKRLREDRVFAAVSALALMGYSGDEPVSWPGGLPAPTREELEVARRRLAQRPQYSDDTANRLELQESRLDLLKRVGKMDIGGMLAASG